MVERFSRKKLFAGTMEAAGIEPASGCLPKVPVCRNFTQEVT